MLGGVVVLVGVRILNVVELVGVVEQALIRAMKSGLFPLMITRRDSRSAGVMMWEGVVVRVEEVMVVRVGLVEEVVLVGVWLVEVVELVGVVEQEFIRSMKSDLFSLMIMRLDTCSAGVMWLGVVVRGEEVMLVDVGLVEVVELVGAGELVVELVGIIELIVVQRALIMR